MKSTSRYLTRVGAATSKRRSNYFVVSSSKPSGKGKDICAQYSYPKHAERPVAFLGNGMRVWPSWKDGLADRQVIDPGCGVEQAGGNDVR